MDRKNANTLMTMLGLTVSMERPTKANALVWFGHALKVKGNPVIVALNFNVRRKSTWKKKVKDSMEKARLKKEDASNRTKRRNCTQMVDL